MQIFKKIIATSIVLLLSIFLFSGCTHRTYKLIGIIEDGATEVTKLVDIQDEEVLNRLNHKYHNSLYIKLKSNSNYELGYTQVDGNTTLKITHAGTYKIDKKNETINFYEPKENGENRVIPHQYTNNMIIYFDGEFHLVLK